MKPKHITVAVPLSRPLIAAVIYRAWLFDGTEPPKRARSAITKYLKGAVYTRGVLDLYSFLEEASPNNFTLATDLAAQHFPEVE